MATVRVLVSMLQQVVEFVLRGKPPSLAQSTNRIVAVCCVVAGILIRYWKNLGAVRPYFEAYCIGCRHNRLDLCSQFCESKCHGRRALFFIVSDCHHLLQREPLRLAYWSS